MKSSLKCFDSYLMNFMIYGLLFGENRHIFLKVHFILKKNLIYFEFKKYMF
jgi:hypothetical protein